MTKHKKTNYYTILLMIQINKNKTLFLIYILILLNNIERKREKNRGSFDMYYNYYKL
jgi:hypothetical protein